MKTISFASVGFLLLSSSAMADNVTVDVESDTDANVTIHHVELDAILPAEAAGDDDGMLSADEVPGDQGLPAGFEADAVVEIRIDKETGVRTVAPIRID